MTQPKSHEKHHPSRPHDAAQDEHVSEGSNATLPKALTQRQTQGKPEADEAQTRDFPSGNPEPHGNHK